MLNKSLSLNRRNYSYDRILVYLLGDVCVIKSYVFLNFIMYICMYAFIISVYLVMFIFHLLCLYTTRMM